jgi:hypothetical protein
MVFASRASPPLKHKGFLCKHKGFLILYSNAPSVPLSTPSDFHVLYPLIRFPFLSPSVIRLVSSPLLFLIPAMLPRNYSILLAHRHPNE